MKKKNGFTLIELLAVIVILAIIALIATPIVLGLINRARKGAATDSAYGVRKEAQLVYSTALMEHPAGFNKIVVDFSKEVTKDGKKYPEAKYYATSSTTDENAKTDEIYFEIDGTKPSSGIVTINGNGKVTYENIVITGYNCTIPESGEVTCGSGSSSNTENNSSNVPNNNEYPKLNVSWATNGETYLGIVYLDPTNLNTVCTSSQASANLNENNTPTGIDSGCMKFYIYQNDIDHSLYKAIVDHNTTPLVIWNESNNNNYELSNIKPIVDNLNQNWNYSVDIMNDQDIEILTGVSFATKSWYYLDSKTNNPTATSKGASAYSWLYDYTTNCEGNGCNIQDNNMYLNVTDNLEHKIFGYWINKSSANSGNSTHVIASDGSVASFNVDNIVRGVRPVISIPYDRINNLS